MIDIIFFFDGIATAIRRITPLLVLALYGSAGRRMGTGASLAMKPSNGLFSKFCNRGTRSVICWRRSFIGRVLFGGAAFCYRRAPAFLVLCIRARMLNRLSGCASDTR
jgi:hypothetical protein